MATTLTNERVWQEIRDNLFAVLGMVTSQDEARTVGIVYAVRNGKLYIATEKNAWKTRHIAHNPHVSLTIPIAKRIPFIPWIKIPAATITFSGEARILDSADVASDILKALYRGIKMDDELMTDSCVIEVTPVGDFITYGVGMPMMQMRSPEKARGRIAVA